MITLDEGTLIAYVDGELDTQTAREVEATLAADPQARQYVEHLRALSALTRIAFNDTLHEAVPQGLKDAAMGRTRSEEHTSELQSHHELVCRLLLEKKKKKKSVLSHGEIRQNSK